MASPAVEALLYGDGFAILVNESDITSDELVTLARSIGVED